MCGHGLGQAVDALDERPFAIGLEMFYRQHQPALDAFVFQDGSFANLKKRTRWASTWGYDFNQYAKILAYARRHGIQLVGLTDPKPTPTPKPKPKPKPNPTPKQERGADYRRFLFLSPDFIIDQKGRAFLVEMNTNGFMPGDDVLYKMQKVSNSVSEY